MLCMLLVYSYVFFNCFNDIDISCLLYSYSLEKTYFHQLHEIINIRKWLYPQKMLIEAWNGSIYRWHGVSLWWKCLSTPFIYTLFYIIYTFGYFTHTDYTHSLPCVLFIICVLCVFYDSIHVLNVMFFSEPYLVLFIIKVSKQVYKVLWWSRIFQLKINESRGPGERVSGECGGNHTTDWLRAICR